MPIKKHTDIKFYIDDTTGVLTDISAYVNQQELERTVALLDDTGEGLEERTKVPGLGEGRLTVNGFVNTTTEAIFGPLVEDNTSITKTVAYRQHSTRFFKAECWLPSVRFSGSREDLQTFSVELEKTGAFDRTSVLGT